MIPNQQPQPPKKGLPKWARGCLWLVVILIVVSVGASLALRNYASSHGGGEGTTARVQMRTLEMLLKLYKFNNGSYPTEQQGLAVIFTKSKAETEEWRRRAEEKMKDPWGRNFRYRFPGKHNPGSYDLYSLGADGIEDTEDDVTNWETTPKEPADK